MTKMEMTKQERLSAAWKLCEEAYGKMVKAGLMFIEEDYATTENLLSIEDDMAEIRNLLVAVQKRIAGVNHD